VNHGFFMKNNITGVILAGGKSARMARDKAFVPFSGKPMIETVIDNLSGLFQSLMIITNTPHLYQKYGIKMRADIIKGCGPLGGVYTALLFSETKYNFIFACDMPFLNKGLISFMVNEANNHDAVIPERDGGLEPLCAIYSKACIGAIKNELLKDNLKVTSFLSSVKTRKVGDKEIAAFDPDGRSFININTPENLRRYKYEGTEV